MRKPVRISAYILICLLFHHLHAQPIERYNTFSYGVNEGLLQTTIRDIEVDKNNFCWIAFPNGVQKFDGHSFMNIPVQQGLPDDKYVSFQRCEHGDLFLGHANGISRYNIETNNFQLIHSFPAALQKPLIFLGQDAGIFYFFTESGEITGIHCINHKVSTALKHDLSALRARDGLSITFSDNIINGKAALKIDSTLFWLDLRNKKVLKQAVIPDLFPSFLLKLKNDQEILYYSRKHWQELQVWDFNNNAGTKIKIAGKDNNIASRCAIFPWRDKVLISFNNRLFEMDSSLGSLKAEWVNFQNQPMAGEVSIAQIRSDNFGNLYLQTVNGGIRKVLKNNYPIKYYGTLDQKHNNILSILPDKKNNRILVGGSGGLFIFDTLQRLIKHIREVPGMLRVFMPNGLLLASNGDYLMTIPGELKILRLNKDLTSFSAIIPTPDLSRVNNYADYFGHALSRTNPAILQTQGRIFQIDLNNLQSRFYQFSDAYIMAGMKLDDRIISHGNSELIHLDAKTFQVMKKVPFPNTSGVRCMIADSEKNILLGTNKGIFRITTDGKILQQWNKSTGLPDECIYAMAFDNNDLLWFSTNKGVFRLNADNSLLQLTKQDGLQENEFNTNVVTQSEDGELFFGGINGVSSFYPSAIQNTDEKINVLLTRIRVNNREIGHDSSACNIDRLKLSYNQNSLSFDFIALASNNPSQYVYQYRMKGIDKEWIQNTGMQTVRYSLPPGKYTLQLFASNSFDKNAVPMKELLIIILPPFWKSWWFFTALAIFLLAVLTYSINQKNKRKYAKKLLQLENERQIKLERERISKDLHDSLGAYANAVLYNADLLEKERTEQKRNELISDLKFASKDIITSLRETVWALKKENYTAEECLLRIRNFIQPFTRYYQHIHFRITGEAPTDRQLHYTKALNLVRIVQEAVSNAIKHAKATDIIVSSSVLSDQWEISIADNGTGFNYNSAKKEEHGNGLFNMEQRAQASGFRYSIESNMQSGTSITIIV